MSRGTGPSTVVAVRIKTALIATLDLRRGNLSRSAYVRKLIENDARIRSARERKQES